MQQILIRSAIRYNGMSSHHAVAIHTMMHMWYTSDAITCHGTGGGRAHHHRVAEQDSQILRRDLPFGLGCPAAEAALADPLEVPPELLQPEPRSAPCFNTIPCRRMPLLVHFRIGRTFRRGKSGVSQVGVPSRSLPIGHLSGSFEETCDSRSLKFLEQCLIGRPLFRTN